MDLSNLANLAEIVSAVAVVITLIYLSTQIRHAREHLELQGRQARADAARDVLLAVSDGAHTARLFAELDDFAWGDHGLASKEEWMSTSWGAGFWDQVKPIYDRDFQLYVEGLRSRLAETPKPATDLLKER